MTPTRAEDGFSNKEILIRLESKVDDGFTRIEKRFDEGHIDHENRIRSLEKFRYSAPSTAVVAIVLAVLSLFAPHLFS